MKAIQEVNEKLTAKGSKDGFDVVLVAKDMQERGEIIVSSLNHYGFQKIKLCYCGAEDLSQTLHSAKAQLFLSLDTSDVLQALQQGIPAALLSPQAWAPDVGDEGQMDSPIKVLISGDVMCLPEEKLAEIGFSQPELQRFRAAKDSLEGLAAVIVEMRRLFGKEDNPLRVTIMSSLGTREEWANALLTARRWGLEVDEAYCLAGAPYGPVLNSIQPTILCYNGLYCTTEVPALS